MNLPNAITVIRILLIPLFLYKVIKGEMIFATAVYMAAAVTDALDGFIARFWGLQTRLGTFLDPLADKLLLTSAFLVMSFLKIIPLWLAMAVISRDVIISLGSLVIYLMQGHLNVRPQPVGKVTTFFQFTYVLLMLLAADAAFAHWPRPAILKATGPLALMTGILTVVSGSIYILDGLRTLEE